MNTASPLKTKKKMKKWQKVLLIILGVLIGLLLITGIAFYSVFYHYYNKMNFVPLDDPDETIIYSIPDEIDEPELPITDASGSELPSEIVQPPVTEDPKIEDNINQNVNTDYVMTFDKNVKNILLVGSDGRTASERGRSDTMILLTINENTGQIILTSFMRDIYLHIPEVDTYNRINAAYAYGGIPLLIKTIRENFKIQIDQYVQVNFDVFMSIVETMGGVDIELSQAEIDYLGLSGKTQPGVVHLDAETALKYCRCRYVAKGNLSGDFARTARQREFLTIMFDKLRGMSIFQLTDLLDEFLPQVTTNLTQGDLLGLLGNFTKYINYDIKTARLPIDGSWKYATIRKMSVLSVDFQKNIEALEKLIRGEN